MNAGMSAGMSAAAPHAQARSAMPELRFGWRGVDADGIRRRGTIISPDAVSARAMLKRDRITVVEIEARGAAARPKASASEITSFTRQLASLLQAGLPLAPALELIAQAPGRGGMPRIVGGLARQIVAGASFSAALGQYGAQFDALYCQLVAVGEASGALAPVLARIADDRERGAAQRAKVRAALTYPVAVLLLALAITAALLVWVVPTFKQVFDGFGARLPAPTQLVLSLSDGVARWCGPVLAASTAFGIAFAYGLRRSAPARLAFDRTMLRLPIVGALVATLAAARWSRALGTLLAAGTPLADAFDSLGQASGHRVFDLATVEIAARMKRGERLAAAMQAVHCFAPQIIQPIAVAEESGALDAMLLDVAALADRQVDDKIGLLASLCEPLIVIVLGALVGGLVVALYLPIIQLGNVV
jgi:type IV pilus assembly protein PilC